MKTLLKATLSMALLAVSMSVSSPGMAQDDVSEKKAFAAAMFPSADASKLWLHLQKYKLDERVNVELINERGQVMFRETLPRKSNKMNCFRQQFDLSQIGDGKYTFRVTAGTQTEEMTFKLATPTLEAQLPVRLISMN